MDRLIGAQPMVLKAILDLPKDAAGYATDSQIAQNTHIAIADVRDWIETLEGDGLVNVARITGGLSASITALGRLSINKYSSFSPQNSTSVALQRTEAPAT